MNIFEKAGMTIESGGWDKDKRQLLQFLIEAMIEEKETIEAIGGCDHSVGVCICGLIAQFTLHVRYVESLTGLSWEEIKKRREHEKDLH